MTLRFACLLLGLAAAPAVVAQPVEPETLTPSSAAPAAAWTDAELEDLVGPIALHPDALIALVLPAATAPSDLVLATRQLNSGATPASVENEAWDDSVKALMRYPEMLRWLDENLAWTKQLGEAFAEHPAEVMGAIQRLRHRARAAGTLKDTPQQRIVVVEEEIRIVPAYADVIYVPRYDPAVVYVERSSYGPYSSFLTFGIGYSAGYWLAYDCDWRRRSVCVVPRHDRVRLWRERHDWSHRIYPRPGPDHRRDDRWHAWHPRRRDRISNHDDPRHRWNDPRHRWAPRPVPPSVAVPGSQQPPTLRRDFDRGRARPDREDIVRGHDPVRGGDERTRRWERPRNPVDRLPSGPSITPTPGVRPVPAVRPVPGWTGHRERLPSGPSVTPAPPVRPVPSVRPAPPITQPRSTPSVRPPPSVRPRPEVVRTAMPSPPRAQPARAPNGRMLPNPDSGPVSGRGSVTRSPSGRMMPNGRSTPEP